MTGKWVAGSLVVTAVIAGASFCAVAIAVDEKESGEQPVPAKVAPAYRASIRATPELEEESRPDAADPRQSPPTDLPKETRKPDDPKTQWVTDLDDAAVARPPDQPIRDDKAAGHEAQPENTGLDPSLAEILRIRRELGTNPYRGTIFERVGSTGTPASGQDGESGNSTDGVGEVDDEFTDALRVAAATAEVLPRSADTGSQSLRWRDECTPDVQLTSDLRQAARGLDVKAADFEDMEIYVEADQLRQLARKLRKTARGLSQSVSAVQAP